MGGNDDDVIKVSAALVDSVYRQIADLTVIADRLVALARARNPELVPLLTRLRDGAGAAGAQVRLLRGRGDGPDAEVRELHPRGEGEQ